MFRTLITVTLFVAVTAGVAPAQNARVDAMAGYDLMDDHTNILANPVFVNDHSNSVQITYDGDVGPVIAVVGLKNMRFGLSYTGDNVLDDDVYAHYLTTVLGAANNLGFINAGNVDPIPNILFGMDLNALKIGARLYYERTSRKNSVQDNQGGNFDETTINERYGTMGFVAGAGLDLNSLMLSVKAGMGVPFLNASYENSITGANPERVTASVNKGIHLEIGGEGRLAMRAADVIVGADLEMTSFKGEWEFTPRVGDVVRHDGFRSTTLSLIDLYGGAEKFIDDQNLLLGVKLSATMVSETDKPNDVTYAERTNTTRDMSYGIRSGLEKTWTELRWLDAVRGRVGLSYETTMAIVRANGSAGPDEYDSRLKHAPDRGGFGLNVGFGIKKNVSQFDVLISPDALLSAIRTVSGQAGGEDFARVTFTMDFGSALSSGGSNWSSGGSSTDKKPSTGSSW